MIHETIEEHLSEICPACGKEHRAKFFSLFFEERHYIVGDCTNCGYHIEFEEKEMGGGIFLPNGEPVNEKFKKSNTEHMRKLGIENKIGAGKVDKSFSRMKLRFLDDTPITEERVR